MRRLLRFVGLVAGVGVVVYLMRDKMVRIPEDAAPPPHFKAANGHTAPPAATQDAPTDDLTDIKGIGPVYAARLREAGIASFAGLAAADPSAIAEAIDVATDQLADWVDQARQRLS